MSSPAEVAASAGITGPAAAAGPNAAASTPGSLGRGELARYSSGVLGETAANGMATHLAQPLLVVTLGLNPALVGLVLSARAFVDAAVDPIIGHASDNHRGRLGRRRPFILAGGLMMSLAAVALWSFSAEWGEAAILGWFGVFMLLLAAAGSVFMVPHFALGVELAPRYHDRTRVASYRAFVRRLGQLGVFWYYPFCLLPVFGGALVGARVLGIGLGLVCVATALTVFFGVREPPPLTPRPPRESLWRAATSLGGSRLFWRLTGVFALMAVVNALVSGAGLFLNIYHVFGGDAKAGAHMAALTNTLGTVLSFAAIPLIAALSRRVGKHVALRVSLVLVLLGNVLSWFVLTPATPYGQLLLPFCFGIGIASVYVLLPAMLSDVIDAEELRSGRRREGLVGAVSAWIVRTTGALMMAAHGLILSGVGFRVELGAAQSEAAILWLRFAHGLAPAMIVAVALALVWRYPLTPQRVDEIARQLEAQRLQR